MAFQITLVQLILVIISLTVNTPILENGIVTMTPGKLSHFAKLVTIEKVYQYQIYQDSSVTHHSNGFDLFHSCRVSPVTTNSVVSSEGYVLFYENAGQTSHL